MSIKYFGFILITMQLACGSHTYNGSFGPQARMSAGEVSRDYGSSLTNANINDNEVYFIDHGAKKLLHVEVEPFRLISEEPLPYAGKDQKIIIGPGGSYKIIHTKSMLSVIQSNGEVLSNPIELVGDYVGYIYGSEQNYFAIYDDLGSMALIHFNEEGGIRSSWVGGPLITDQQAIQRGEFSMAGQLILGTGDNSLFIIDFEQSIVQGRWVFEQKSVEGAGSISFLAPLKTDDNRILLQDEKRIILYDLEQGIVTDEKSTELISYSHSFKGEVPHIITKSVEDGSTGVVDVYYVDATGNLVHRKVNSRTPIIQITYSHIDLNTEVITLGGYSGERGSPHYLAKVRMTDGLYLYRQSVPGETKVAFTPNALVLKYDSKLGYLERWLYKKHFVKQIISKFNLEILN